MLRTFIASIFLIATLSTPLQVEASTDFSDNFKAYLDNTSIKALKDAPLYKDDILSFYEARDFEPVWYDDNNRELEDINGFKELIYEQAYLNGLEPADYPFEAILKIQAPTGDAMFEREWMLTNTLMHYINDIRTGRIKPHKYDSMIFTLPQHRALDERAAKLIEAWNPEKYLVSLAPPQTEYKRLREKLALYRAIAEDGGWPKVSMPSGTLLYPGDAHESVPQIRRRLEAAYHEHDGYLPDGIWIDQSQLATEELADRIIHQGLKTDEADMQLINQDPALLYDGALAKKVAEFQYFHGKKADGVVGPETMAVLSHPIETHIDKIKFAMERWRWLPDDLGEKHVRVNIAAFYARAVQDGEDQFVMPIIVGKVAHQTPVFSSVIKNVKIHPDWTSPDSISDRYVIPKIQKDPSVVHTLGYEAIYRSNGQVIPWEDLTLEALNTRDFIFRQKPGNKNALGLARFSIENNYAIFMHGTSSVQLFNEDDRHFSSGCVRLENPLIMAHFLLNDQGMSKSELEDLYLLDDDEFPETTYVNLKEDVPVHLMYMTAWVDQAGHLHFADDIYSRDSQLKESLKELN